MKKWIIILLMVLLLIPTVLSLEECNRVMNPGDIPCILASLMKSKWVYTNSCNTYTAYIYNSNYTLLDTRTMGSYAGRCNITFDYTDLDSYYINFSQAGDSAIIIVEGEDKMASLSVMLFVCGITFALIFIGIKFNFSDNIIANIIFKRVLILLGMFLLSLDTAIIVTMADNAGLGVNKELFRYLWMINWMIKQDGRIGKMETKTKLLMWFFGITIALMALFQII